MFCLNFDAGHVDPTDSSDMTRARVVGVSHYAQDRYRADDHPTMIAPMLGVRQGRHIHTHYTLTLTDLINHSQFDDVVAYTRCHYDNHAVDYELESDEALFWVWVCRQWHRQLHCDVPYRCLIPHGIDNLWVACRALGVSQDAQFVLRMQRDMQRIGEVAGLAAAMASREHISSSQVDYPALAAMLRANGALRDAQASMEDDQKAKHARVLETECQSPADLWALYQAGPARAGQVVTLLSSAAVDVSWHASAVAAMWGMPQAQARLCQAIALREEGHAYTHARQQPTHDYLTVPRWLAAIGLLRVCGNEDCLQVLGELAHDRNLVANVRTSIAITLQRITKQNTLTEASKDKIRSILLQLLASKVPLKAAPPRRSVLDTQIRPEPDHGYWRPAVVEDFHWQMHWAIARALLALGMPAHRGFWSLLEDRRAFVRRAAEGIAASGENLVRPQATPDNSDLINHPMVMPSLLGVS